MARTLVAAGARAGAKRGQNGRDLSPGAKDEYASEILIYIYRERREREQICKQARS